MKHVDTMPTADLLKKVEKIEREIFDLKLTLLKNFAPGSRKIISLKGILKDISVTEADISSAKKSLYSKIGA